MSAASLNNHGRGGSGPIHGASFKNRPHSLNNRLFQVPEAAEEPLGNNFELSATGFGGMRAPPINQKKNSQRLARDMQ